MAVSWQGLPRLLCNKARPSQRPTPPLLPFPRPTMPGMARDRAAPVPAVVKDFVRLVVRAFGSPAAIVLVGAILRTKHARVGPLSKALQLPAGQLGSMLRLVCSAGFLRSERRRVRVVCTGTQRGLGSTALADVYLVPYADIMDFFSYRVDRVRTELDAQLARGGDDYLYRCPQCHALYSALDAASRTDRETGGFRCHAEAGRAQKCGTLLKERGTPRERAVLAELGSRLESELAAVGEICRVRRGAHARSPARWAG